MNIMSNDLKARNNRGMAMKQKNERRKKKEHVAAAAPESWLLLRAVVATCLWSCCCCEPLRVTATCVAATLWSYHVAEMHNEDGEPRRRRREGIAATLTSLLLLRWRCWNNLLCWSCQGGGNLGMVEFLLQGQPSLDSMDALGIEAWRRYARERAATWNTNWSLAQTVILRYFSLDSQQLRHPCSAPGNDAAVQI